MRLPIQVSVKNPGNFLKLLEHKSIFQASHKCQLQD